MVYAEEAWDKMISAAAQTLEASGLCEIGPATALNVAEEMLVAALNSGSDLSGNKQENMIFHG